MRKNGRETMRGRERARIRKVWEDLLGRINSIFKGPKSGQAGV